MRGIQRGRAEGECGILPGPFRGKTLATCRGLSPSRNQDLFLGVAEYFQLWKPVSVGDAQ